MNKIAPVKKYKATLNLIVSILISLITCFLIFAIPQASSNAIEINLFFFVDLSFAFLIFLILFRIAIKVFKKQYKFNKNAPSHYIEYSEKELKIKNKIVKIEEIKSITYTKICKWELFGEAKEENYGYAPLPFFKFEKGITEKARKKGTEMFRKSIQKSNLGNIKIELKDKTLQLKRVQNIEESVRQLNAILSKKEESL